MELPHTLLHSIGFMFSDPEELIRAIGSNDETEETEIRRLMQLGLPPIVSASAISVMFGYNPGFIHSMTVSPKAHYRFFSIPKGRGERNIVAPKVAIKGIQKWMSHHIQKAFVPSSCVYGFVPGRSHIDAAIRHLGAAWVCSVDIENFFPSIRAPRLNDAFRHIGYQSNESLLLLQRLTSINGTLVQGAPTSPVLSNVVLRELDKKLSEYAASHNLIFTRYADDIVVSGQNPPPGNIVSELSSIVEQDGWTVAARKTLLAVSPNRLKVHGLLVHGSKVRLTKGYRNRIRAYRHLLANGRIQSADLHSIRGHINYANQIEQT